VASAPAAKFVEGLPVVKLNVDPHAPRPESAGSLTLSGGPADCSRDSDGIRAHISRRRAMAFVRGNRPQCAFEGAVTLPAIRPSHHSMTLRAQRRVCLAPPPECRLERHRRRRITDPGGHQQAREATNVHPMARGAGSPTDERSDPMGTAGATRAIEWPEVGT
jgi:hypothetical protein